MLPWIATLGAILKLDADVFVPGHGPVGNRDQLKQFLGYLDDLKASVEPRVSRGDSMEQVLRETQVPAKYASFDFQNFFPANVQRMYIELKELRASQAPGPVPKAVKKKPQDGSFLAMACILISGASGFLGQILTLALAREHRVIAGFHNTRPRLERGEIVPLDVTQPDQLADQFRRLKPDLVVHGAALSQPDACEKAPRTGAQRDRRRQPQHGAGSARIRLPPDPYLHRSGV